jgi:hypothetical protein
MTHFLPKVIERYSGMHLHEIHYSPLFAHGEGVGGGVFVSQSTDNRYKELYHLSTNSKIISTVDSL